MAKITKDENLELSSAEAIKLVRNADGRVRFQIKVSAFMPTEPADAAGNRKGFEGVTFITVSKSEMISIIPRLLSSTFEARGAKLRVKTTPPAHERDLSFISIS